MNTVQQARFAELQAAVANLARSFAAGNQDAFDEGCNLIIGTLRELSRDFEEQAQPIPASMTLAALMESGRLPMLIGGESPSD